ncbi:MAG: HEAT repeat domain-containing protein [Armatimonadetes bacterium]|nr:HEAT repeat domain-containing protein [Armatimonadota bacterium]
MAGWLPVSLGVAAAPKPVSATASKSGIAAPPMAKSKTGADPAFRRILSRAIPPSSAPSTSLRIPGLRRDRLYSFTFSMDANGGRVLPCSVALRASLRVAGQTLGSKELHCGDPDLYLLVRPPRDGEGEIRIESVEEGKGRSALGTVSVRVQGVEWNADADRVRTASYEPNGSWRQATPMNLGQTVFGSGDLAPYIPKSVEEITRYYDAARQSDAPKTLSKGEPEDWLVFELRGDPKLATFQIDLPERDQVPPDVSVHVEKSGQVVPYEEGDDPVAGLHELQALPANKFITRILQPGRYYVRVLARHPEWRLRTQVMDPPPYRMAPPAIRTGVNYLLGAGDSWHANTPRAGARLNRVSNIHAETAQCIACHPTQFATRGALTAKENGYETLQRAALQFLTERMANNPRPFPGHSSANWARMISAPGNVTSRAADLVAVHADLMGESLPIGVLDGAYNYLKLYYKDRTTLPEDETNGNQPLISQYEVVYHAWKIFDRVHRTTGKTEARKYADRLLTLLEQNRHRTMIDLSWQTVAMAKADPKRFAKQIKANTERILSLQREDGQWAMPFDGSAAPAEFQTGHALYALAVAGYKPDHPQVKKSVDFLLGRQQPFGGWFDPLQSFENFRTPFRETQFAVMALSELYPAKKAAGKGSDRTDKGIVAGIQDDRNSHDELASLDTSDPLVLLRQIDGIWEKPSARVMAQLVALLKHDEPMVRETAALALGRVGESSAVPSLVDALGDPAKGVQRSAAVALRRLGGRGIGLKEVQAALQSPDERRRWGALRVFAAHFRPFVFRPELAESLLRLTKDPSAPVRMAAIQSLWQWNHWTDDMDLRDRIMDAVLARLAVEEHPWVARNAREALYNLADENIRYLHNNWIPALGVAADREAATAGQVAREERLARKLAAAIESGNPRLREGVLRGIGDFHLRNVYQRSARYNRIGNDVEQIRFSKSAALPMEKALRVALNDPSPAVRRHALVAAFTLRENGPLPVALSVVNRLNDPDADVRRTAREFYRAIPLETSGEQARRAAAILGPMLRSPHEEARKSALELLLAHKEIAGEEAARESLQAWFTGPAPEVQRTVVEIARQNPPLRRNARVLNVLSDALLSKGETIRRPALDLVQADKALADQPLLRATLDELARSAEGPSAEAARTLLAKQTDTPSKEAVSLDYGYFAREVMPIFARKSPQDGIACVSCHFNHNLFKVTPPDPDGKFKEDQIREAYRSALKVVNLREPEKSLLIVKPMSTAATEGLVDAVKAAHGGGQRWPGTEHPDYRTLLAWLKGAKAGAEVTRNPASK